MTWVTRKLGTLWLFVVLWAALPVVAQPDNAPSDLVEAMRDAYRRLDYATAERRGREALASFDTFSADQLVEVHTTLGLILHAQSEPLEARTQFEAALSLDPGLELDPLLVSPKTVDFFGGVKAGLVQETGAAREPVVRYVRVRDLRPAATARSLVLPGWGQLYKGDRTKGWVLAGLWGAAVAGAATTHLFRQNARSDYLAATDPADIAERYNTFNAMHQARNAFALGLASVWLYAAADALLVRGGDTRALRLAPVHSTGGVGLHVQVSF